MVFIERLIDHYLNYLALVCTCMSHCCPMSQDDMFQKPFSSARHRVMLCNIVQEVENIPTLVLEDHKSLFEVSDALALILPCSVKLNAAPSSCHRLRYTTMSCLFSTCFDCCC